MLRQALWMTGFIYRCCVFLPPFSWLTFPLLTRCKCSELKGHRPLSSLLCDYFDLTESFQHVLFWIMSHLHVRLGQASSQKCGWEKIYSTKIKQNIQHSIKSIVWGNRTKSRKMSHYRRQCLYIAVIGWLLW